MLPGFLIAGGAVVVPAGQQEYTVAGSDSFVVPDGVFSICAVAVGGGAKATSVATGGPSGSALAYANTITVTPGETLDVVVGDAGNGSTTNGGLTSLKRSSTTLLAATGGIRSTATAGISASTSGSVGDVINAGGDGGSGTNVFGGAGGAGGYSGLGGDGGSGAGSGVSGHDGNGGGGGGGTGNSIANSHLNSGGVGLQGQGSNGTGGTTSADATAGSATGTTVGASHHRASGNADPGGLRIIYGPGRAFPSTGTADV